MKKYSAPLHYLLLIILGLSGLTASASLNNALLYQKINDNMDSLLVKQLFYKDYWKNTQDTCILITSPESLKKYTDKGYNIDFKKNSVLVILKSFEGTEHHLSFKDIKMKHDTLIITYVYEVTNKEVEGPPKKLGMLIPNINVPIKILEHKIRTTDITVESIKNRELKIED